MPLDGSVYTVDFTDNSVRPGQMPYDRDRVTQTPHVLQLRQKACSGFPLHVYEELTPSLDFASPS